jgi:hypothetical protein
MGVARVNWDHERIVLILEDKPYYIPWQDARQLAQAIILMAQRAEEWENKERIIKDAAILRRAGSPFGIISNPALKSEAEKMARHDRDLRRYMPSVPESVESGEVVSAPTILQPKTPLERLEAMTPEARAEALRKLKGE